MRGRTGEDRRELRRIGEDREMVSTVWSQTGAPRLYKEKGSEQPVWKARVNRRASPSYMDTFTLTCQTMAEEVDLKGILSISYLEWLHKTARAPKYKAMLERLQKP